MPLSALVNGDLKYSIFMESEEWEAFKAQNVTIQLRCCGSRGFMRTSKLGTQHFCHVKRPEYCTSEPESEQHLELKCIVASAVRDVGWKADLEAPDPEGKWRADVLATRNSARVAFEVQLSSISLEDLKKRQAAYLESRVRGCWFGRGPVARRIFRKPERELPVFWFGDDDRLERDALPSDVYIDQNLSFPIKAAVHALLRKEIKWCNTRRVRTVEGLFLYRTRCFDCGRNIDIYVLAENQRKCGDVPALAHAKLKCSKADFEALCHPNNARYVKKYVATNQNRNFMICYPIWEENWLWFPCVHCGELQDGRSLLRRHLGDPLARIQTRMAEHPVAEGHWCHSPQHSFCC